MGHHSSSTTDLKAGKALFNARSDSLTTKWPWRYIIPARRCVIPADGFYEWRREGKLRLQYHVRMKAGGVFGFAGVWTPWRPKGSEQLLMYTCAIVPTDANEAMQTIAHNRMPSIMTSEFVEEWLNPDNIEPEPLLDLLQPYDSDQMEVYRVSTIVNTTRKEDKVDSPQCIIPTTDDAPAPGGDQIVLNRSKCHKLKTGTG